MKRFWILIALLTAFGLFAAACGGGGDIPDLHEPGVLNQLGPDPNTLDPHICGNTGCAPYVMGSVQRRW